MNQRMMIGAWLVTTLVMAPIPALAQMPGGIQVPGSMSLPTGGVSKDALLNQATQMVTELTEMKSSGKLAAEQATQVDALLPKATSLKSELAKPALDATKLPQLASDLSDMQKQVGALKALVK